MGEIGNTEAVVYMASEEAVDKRAEHAGGSSGDKALPLVLGAVWWVAVHSTRSSESWSPKPDMAAVTVACMLHRVAFGASAVGPCAWSEFAASSELLRLYSPDNLVLLVVAKADAAVVADSPSVVVEAVDSSFGAA